MDKSHVFTVTRSEIRREARRYGFSPTDEQCDAIAGYIEQDIFDLFKHYADFNMLGDEDRRPMRTFSVEVIRRCVQKIYIEAEDREDAKDRANELIYDNDFYEEHLRGRWEDEHIPGRWSGDYYVGIANEVYEDDIERGQFVSIDEFNKYMTQRKNNGKVDSDNR